MNDSQNKTDDSDQLEPVDAVIEYIKGLLNSGELQPGNKLPSERKLAEQVKVGRTHIRNALQKLELYGIIKTFPQSGSVVAGLKIQALDGLISDVLKIESYDFRSLVEMRIILEVQAIRMCALNHNKEDLRVIEEALKDFTTHFNDSLKVEKDFIFHRAITQGSHNPVLASMLLTITPDILKYYDKHCVCGDSSVEVIREHVDMIECIIARDADRAEQVMRQHLRHLDEFSKSLTKEFY